MIMTANNHTAVDAAIRQRRTLKVIGDLDKPPAIPDNFADSVREMVDVAAWAPYHKPAHTTQRRGELTSTVPWRFYVFDGTNCRQLLQTLQRIEEESGDPSWMKGKIPGMLATAGAMIQATWLPNPKREPSDLLFEPTEQNMEHIAAASCAVQNLLVAATARGVENYWSSGGVLKSTEIFGLLNIPHEEILLGSIFLFPTITDDMEQIPGKLRDKRGDVGDWAKWVTLS